MQHRASRLIGILGATLGVAGVVLVGGVLGAACLETPTLQFVQAVPVSDAGPDSGASVVTPPFDASVPQQVLDNDGTDAGPDAPPPTPIACGSGTVNSCGGCAGNPLLCVDEAGTRCVADCTACGSVPTYPCWHCPASGKIRGQCLALNANGKLACNDANRCTCDVAADCPKAAGASQTCLGADVDAGLCATCGENKTGSNACAASDGTSGTCKLNGAVPVCR